LKKIIVWPHYLECSLPRRLGRRVSRDLCIHSITIEDILRACSNLSLSCEVESDKKYPRVWYDKQGRVLIEFDGSKNELLKMLAKEIRKLKSTGTK